ncbi:UNVERIFIED_CONTAM: Beta-D-glucosyl crocetin beta-1,6-glucosyltransferase [Sesamum radiatum]|uniref:Beta-D-glucosyl crocetin beta-1,6-glucosyltransferase n=1 Tax=Sesamum radiatum TaxID=300843 RepID=A0AAW2TKE2_SESRA
MSSLKEAFDLSVNDFSNILKQLKPDLLIYDIVQPWAPLVAKEHNIPAVEFITSSSTMNSFVFHYFKMPWIEFPFPNIYCRDYEYSDMKALLECGPTEKNIAFEGVERSCEIVLIKGFRDIEGKYIDYVTSLFGTKFVPVGPLVPEPIPDEKEDESSGIFSWLDMKERKSTVFVSFGSEYFLSKEEMDEIAYGLELSKINFIWVVRFPRGANGHNGLLEKTLPRGFLERVGDRSKILEGWAPQTKILEHENIGGFVSHCGWNSVIESMNFGVPIIAVPMHFDQPINARLVEEVGVGVEVLRDRNRMLNGERLAAVIQQVVMEDCGEVVRQKAAEMKKKLKSKGDEEIDEVVNELVTICNNS